MLFRAAAALISWPLFSLTSFRVVSTLARQGIEPKVVIDVGANAGQFAIAAAKLWPRCQVHSFEPVPDSARALARNCETLPSVAVYETALGEREGTAQIHVNRHSHSSSILPLGLAHRRAFPEAEEVGTITVKVVTLDSFLANLEVSAPVLLKLDVQGYELNVIRGASRFLGRVDYVLAETSFKPMYDGEPLFPELLAEMAGRGFDFLRPVDWMKDPRTGEVLQMDALFARRTA